MESSYQAELLINPPVDSPGLRSGNWVPVPTGDQIAAYITANLWKGNKSPEGWELARRSTAVYIYRETRSGWAVGAKFYKAKSSTEGEKYAQRELDYTRAARRAGLSAAPLRAITPLALWRSVLFLEFVEGLTLEDLIAVRRSRPGSLYAAVGQVAALFARLHSPERSPTGHDDFPSAIRYGHKVVSNLARHGVLQEDPIVEQGLIRQLDNWAEQPAMNAFIPALTHGDATTTNFIISDQEKSLVAIDWERAKVTDPGADLGRLMAEVTHSLTRYGGNIQEAAPLLDHFLNMYRQSIADERDPEPILARSRFYHAVSALRIARNGWLPRLERMHLVAQAFALLAR
jgi:aminoglycoside phosphotransferase (APT) family kinase protein